MGRNQNVLFTRGGRDGSASTIFPAQPSILRKITTALVAAIVLSFTIIAGVMLPATPAVAAGDVNDFEIASFHADYTLVRDVEGRSTLTTIEHIVAVFPEYDQNRGLIRDLPRDYLGHDTDLQVLSVTNERGTPRGFTTEPYGDFLAVTIAVPEGQFVHGEQHYVIEYTQRDVTNFFADTGVDEFYWDVNGTEWAQPFGSISATVTLSPELESSLTGAASCYLGVFGSTQTCELQRSEHGFTAEASDLGPRENMSFALAFMGGTFTQAPEPVAPPQHFLQQVPLMLWAGAASFIAATVTFVTALLRGRGAKTGRAIIAQYEPPHDVSVAVSAQLLKQKRKTMTATLLDFAVRRKLRLLHHAETDQYGIAALDHTGLDSTESRTYARLFTGKSGTTAASVAPDTVSWFERTSTRLGDTAADLTKRASAEVTKRGLMKRANVTAILVVIALLVLALALPVVHTIIFDDSLLLTVLLAVGINLLVWLIIGAGLVLGLQRRLTPEGALLHDHLQGLREYIRLAEADRIRMLQSASGAEVDTNSVVKIYERLLPYAVLFGFEKEWQGELARYYRESTPDWVYDSGGNTFTHALPLALFAQSVSSAPVTRTQYSGSGSGGSFSSSMGGSSGGGFSGGGGGGGGGRGI
ncbi:MAG: DUF2207 domain-containing protein [Microbacteriaceae bacterium]|nr:DUF2207 domain-containing protein [Microbacteriaceae bacterium]